MPTYQVTDSQSGAVLQLTGDSPPTPDELTNIFSKYDKAPAPQAAPAAPSDSGVQTSAGGAFTRGAATGVVPAFSARGGAWAGAEIGALIPGLGETGIPELVGGIGGAIIGGILGDRAQKAALKAVAPETHDELEKFQNEDAKDHPIAAAAGNLAGSLPAFKLQNPIAAANGLAALAKIARGNTVTAVEKQAAKTFATQLGIGTAAGAISPLVQGQKPTASDITQGIAQMILFGEGRGFKGGESDAVQKRSAETPAVGEAPGRGATVGEGIPQPEEPAGTQEANTKTPRKVTAYRVEGGEDGGWVVTAPDGSVVSEHSSLDEAKLAADNLSKPPAQQKSSPISDTPKVSRDVFQMGMKDFFDWSKGVKGGLTGEAYRIGQAAKTPQDLAELQNKVDVLKQQFQEALATKDVGKLQVLGPKIQFFNEAIGAAKGTGSAGEALRKEQPGYQPPHPEPSPVPKLSPEIQGHLDAAVKDMGVKHVLADASDPNNPFAKRLGDAVATVDPESGQAIINPENLEKYAQQAPPEKRGLLVRSVVSEENNHLHVSNKDAEDFAKTKTSAERAIIEHRYGVKGMTDRMLGHEAINFELHDLARMEPHQMIAATRRERWTLQTLQALEKIIRNIRRALGTKASIEGDAILKKIQKNLEIGKKELESKSKSSPEARDRNEEKVYSGEYWMNPSGEMERAPDGHLDAAINKHGAPNAEGDGKNTYDHMAQKGFARVFATGSQILTSGTPTPKQMAVLKNIAIESGKMLIWDTPSGRDKLIYDPREDETPAARPRKRPESVFQDKFFLPGEATQKRSGSTQAVPISGEAPTVPPEERTGAEAAGALPRITGQRLDELGSQFIRSSMTFPGEEGGIAPKFDDFVSYMKRKSSGLQPGQLFEMWQRNVSDVLENMSGEELRKLAENEFKTSQTIKGIRRIESVRESKGEEAAAKLQSRGEGARSIWDRQITDKAATDPIISHFHQVERRLADLRSQRTDLINTHEHSAEDVKELDNAIRDTSAQKTRLQEGYEAAKRSKNWRARVQSAVYRRMVKPELEGEDARLNRKEIAPEDIRVGGGSKISAYEDVGGLPESKLIELLKDRARRSSDDSPSITQRTLVLRNPRSGTVHIVSAYPRGKDIRVVDPISPTRENVPLKSIQNRYQILHSILLDQPVRKFRQDFRDIADYNQSFGNEAKRLQDEALSYHPESMSESEFKSTVGGRISGGEGGSFQGPHKDLVVESSGGGAMEAAERVPLKDAEANALADHIVADGDPKSVDDVMDSLGKFSSRPEKRSNQAVSALAKMARTLQRKNPDVAAQDLKRMLATEILAAHKNASSLKDFARRLGAVSEDEGFEDEDSPRAVNRRQLSQQRDQLDDDVTKLASRTMAAFLRQPTADRLSSTLDAADTLSNNEARSAEQSIRLESLDKKNFYGKPEILSAANAKLSAGGVKARYHYDQDALDEADRLMNEDPEIKKMADFANRKRDQKNQQMMLEGEVANQGLQKAIQQRLIQTGFLNHEQATYFHDPEAKAKLDEFMVHVNNGIEGAGRMAKGDAWDRFRARRWLKGAQQLKAELEFAKAHWDNPELIATAMKMKRELDAQFDIESKNGYHINYDPNYLPGRYDGELFSQNGVLFGGLRLLGKQFHSGKVFPTYYHAIEAGPWVAASRDGASIVSSRVRQGMRSLNRTMWWNSLKGYKDEASGKPVAVDGKEVNGELVSPSPEYNHPFKLPGKGQIFIMDGYEHLIHQLTDPSAIQHWALTRAALEAGQFLKHTVLAGDLFHLGRVAYYGLSISGKDMKWRPGWAALDFREADLPKAVEKNLISKETAAWLTEKLPYNANGVLTTRNRMELSREFQKQGFNVGQIQDALYKDLVRNIPGFGAYSKFLFDRFTRGQMMNSALTEFQRISRIDPNTDSRLTMRDISRDLNNYFGSIGRQGWVKSATFQDLGRLAFLAPQWLEGLLKKEMSPIHMVTQPKRVFSGKDTTLRGIGRGLLAMVALTQTLNMITRRQPTWQNQEKEHKWDAYLGDNVWLSPLAVFNELTGDLTRLIETKPKAWDAIQQVGENKLGFYGRAAMVLATGKSSTGEYQTTTGGVLRNAAEQLIPAPISFGTIGKAIGHAVAPGLVGAVPPGRVLAQAFSSMGFKTHTGISMETRMEQSADAFNKAHGKNDSAVIGYTSDPSYSQLRYFLNIGDKSAAKKMLAQLEKNRSPSQIIQAMKEYARRPFTGSQRSERLWLAGMSDEERSQYQQAVDERYALESKFYDVLQQ